MASRSAADIEVQAALLDAMGLDDEAVVVLHVGGVYGDRTAALARFARRYERLLSPPARRRLVLENDDGRFGMSDVLWLHRETGVRVVFDVHHFHVHHLDRSDGMDEGEAALAGLATWQGWDARPKIHVSSPRTDWGFRYGSAVENSGGKRRSPNWASHAESVDPFAFLPFYRRLVAQTDRLPDVMLEAKAKDVAVLELRRALNRYAPDLAALFGPHVDRV
jgi:UV DNA damage endonuclease